MTVHSLSHPQPEPQVDFTFTRRASDGDIQPLPVAAEKILGTNGEAKNVKMSTGASRGAEFSIPPTKTPATSTAPGSSDMHIAASTTRLQSGHQEPANPAQIRSAATHISVPDSLLPQLANDSRPSADPSLRPLALPADVGQSLGAAGSVTHPVPSEPHSSIAGPEYRPQSRNTTSSITPPNAYELLPHNLYASLHISPQDPHASSIGNNNIHSPVGSGHSPVNGGYIHTSYNATWTPHMPEQGRSIIESADAQGSSEMRHDYGMPQYHRTSTSGPNNQEGSFARGREYHHNGSHPSIYQVIPDSNMAYMSMHQSLDPQMYASAMLPLTNSFGYQPMYSYYDGRPPTYLHPAANGWMAMQPPVYPFMANSYAGNMQSGRGGQYGTRARGRGRGYGSNTYRPQRDESRQPAQLSHGGYGQPQWNTPRPNGQGVQINGYMGTPHAQQPARPRSISSHPAGASSVGSSVVLANSHQEDLPARDAVKSSEMLLDGENTNKILERKAYHPAPPANRSEWVMWVGNVPANATHEEMWRLFNSPLDRQALSQISSETDPWLGVASIFLISRSNCAFVNLKNESNLRMAIAYFNGRSLRPWDSRCQPFLCRIRKADDDLKSGVGGQRGAGLHIKYIKDLRARENADSTAQKSQITDAIVSSTSNTSESTLPISPAALEEPPEGEGRRRESVIEENPIVTPAAFASWQEQQHNGQSSSAEHSYASTCSSFLVRNFPKRYFIMKSSTYEELERSFQSGVWRTQPHNEPILDQAYRTSPEVYLIFGANKQGSFSGYAIMRSGIPAVARKPSSYSSQGQETSLSSHSSRSTNFKSTTDTRPSGLLSPRGADIQEEPGDVAEPIARSFRLPSVDSNPESLAVLSPGEITPGDDLRSPPTGSPLSYKWNQTAPQPDVRQSPNTREAHPRAMTFDTKALARLRAEEALKRELASQAENTIENFELDKNAALDAQRDTKENDSDDLQNIVRQDMVSNDEKRAPAATQVESGRNVTADTATEIISPEQKRSAGSKDNGNHPNDQHSHMFKVEWIQVGELPFSSIKSLRNPWNQDKEVKVSRDGTELEPTIGAALLAEWSNLQGSTAPVANAVSAHRASQGTGRDLGRF